MQALDLARYVIYFTHHTFGQEVTNLRLQKSLYFLQKEMLQTKGVSLINEAFTAWPFGPVVENVYYNYSQYGADALPVPGAEPNIDDEHTKEFVCSVLKKYKDRAVWDLVRETHKTGGAWDRTYKNGQGRGLWIDNEDIKTYG